MLLVRRSDGECINLDAATWLQEVEDRCLSVRIPGFRQITIFHLSLGDIVSATQNSNSFNRTILVRNWEEAEDTNSKASIPAYSTKPAADF